MAHLIKNVPVGMAKPLQADGLEAGAVGTTQLRGLNSQELLTELFNIKLVSSTLLFMYESG